MRKEKFSCWISVIAMLISVASVCVAIYRNEVDLGFDYLGFLVSILATISALLLGWQIFSIINFDERVRKMAKEVSAEVIKENNSSIEALIGALTCENDINTEPEYIDTLFEVAEKASNGVVPHSALLPFFFIETIIKSKKDGFLVLLPNRKDHYISVVKKSEYRNKKIILNALKNADVVENLPQK